MKTDRPPSVTDDRLEYLDHLRESGITNMSGAGRYLQKEYYIGRAESQELLEYWMRTFGQEDR
jgi:hypothetical protein